MGFDFIQVSYGLITAGIGFFISRLLSWFFTHRRGVGQRALFAGIDGLTYFVFAPRENVETALLPRMSTEDFLAINNTISSLILVDARVDLKMRDSKHISESEKKQGNLILICSSKSNNVTKEALDELRKTMPEKEDLIPSFEYDKDGKVFIRWNKGTYPSDSFNQDGPEFNDIAMIVKARSPWAGQHKILIIAGIRGFGTWGAAECMKKWWQPIYAKKESSLSRRCSKSGDFAALVSIRYRDYDIKEAKLLHLVDLDGTSSQN